jgi:hypothetical protein
MPATQNNNNDGLLSKPNDKKPVSNTKEGDTNDLSVMSFITRHYSEEPQDGRNAITTNDSKSSKK